MSVVHKSAGMSSPLKIVMISSWVASVIHLVYSGLWSLTALMISFLLCLVTTKLQCEMMWAGVCGGAPSHAAHGSDGGLNARW